MSEIKSVREILRKANAARQAGLEGRARVLCRLAAATAIHHHLIIQGKPAPTGDTLDTLTAFSGNDSLPEYVREALNNLTMRVDQDYNLPVGIDLIRDVERILLFFDRQGNHQEEHDLTE